MKLRFFSFLTFFTALSSATFGQTIWPVDPLEIEFAQIGLEYEGLPAIAHSRYGWVSVDIEDMLLHSTGGAIQRGFLNVSTSEGWVVRNMPIDSEFPYPSLGTVFNLGLVFDVVAQLQARATVSDLPLLLPLPLLPTSPSFQMQGILMNPQGFDGMRTSNPDPFFPVDFFLADFLDPLHIEMYSQAQHPNIHQEKNQCAPAGVANSLKYLEVTTGVKATNHPHVEGLLDDTLVGQLDHAMFRDVGQTVTGLELIRGKMDYLDDNDLEHNVRTEHKEAPGVNFVPATVSSGDDDDPERATSTEEPGDLTMVEYIVDRVRRGYDIELGMRWEDGGGHIVQLVGAGYIMGRPYIIYSHDAKQGDNQNGTAANQGGVGFSFIADDLTLTSYIDGTFSRPKIELAVAENTVRRGDEDRASSPTPLPGQTRP